MDSNETLSPELRPLMEDVVRECTTVCSCNLLIPPLQLKNEDNYEGWEKLVTATEAQEGGLTRNSSANAIESFRVVYDRFLNKFPLFFGYWRKYADLEFAIAGTEASVNVRIDTIQVYAFAKSNSGL